LKHVDPLLVASVRAILPNQSASGSLFGEVYEALDPYVREVLGPNPGEGGQTLVLWYDKVLAISKARAFSSSISLSPALALREQIKCDMFHSPPRYDNEVSRSRSGMGCHVWITVINTWFPIVVTWG